MKQLWRWIEIHVLGSRCPKCGARWSEGKGRVWTCPDCGYQENSKV